ncbi:crossover junction endodeoxyribonuclease RuvC [Carboxydothermus ferrireducens]|uniref:Crossover junction endodeoxyribonuclease RuvC n=1 Tax=Carboxydothermus ferrireducens DSM 11255 TaxID=1119529 RepID=A0ABX2RBH4_9THEO|nr:crossover junction endodeoxyribonuclease RuvC [Carboxydothermus ferrireducens]NYE58295.1 crossover junction endodeoxyribonuclease RuvC [Carboxydothermus ferrireducens DSM 11255]
MKIIGIDPGTAIVGVGVLEKKNGKLIVKNYQAITTPPIAKEKRLKIIFQKLNEILIQEKPEIVVVEELFFSKNVKTAISVGEARGVVLLASALNDIPVLELKPVEVKTIVTGYGHAPKSQVEYMIAKLLGLKTPPKPDDVADALAIAYAGFLKMGGLL